MKSDSKKEFYKVKVTVGCPNGAALGGIVCSAFDVDLRKEIFLGEATSNDEGFCSISYNTTSSVDQKEARRPYGARVCTRRRTTAGIGNSV